jgi:hypothetical protein
MPLVNANCDNLVSGIINKILSIVNAELTIKQWLANDQKRMQALNIAASCNLPDWWLAAGFVRNLVWDQLHGYAQPTPLNDLDLIYFCTADTSKQRDRQLEHQLIAQTGQPWSVKNQARMHLRNLDAPYLSAADAMSYWIEIETAVGATLNAQGEICIIAPLGLQPLFELTITLNPKRQKLLDFQQRICEKKWFELWPKLRVKY